MTSLFVRRRKKERKGKQQRVNITGGDGREGGKESTSGPKGGKGKRTLHQGCKDNRGWSCMAELDSKLDKVVVNRMKLIRLAELKQSEAVGKREVQKSLLGKIKKCQN